ncbi:MAG: alanine--tRNA ligase [Candidatus Actinomarina sp.]|nr:alanine--tRNA ligase [Candidatus Actinomarina sp.]
MKSNEIRSKFLEYFQEHNHKILSSASLIPHDDTLLFTAAGMVPLKDYFSGTKTPDNRNMASSQKCIRTVDIDIVGETDRHLTFFEMLGNFSVGEYFKKEAIRYSYDFITNILGVDPNKIWITVYKNDDEAFDIWKDEIGISELRIQRGDKDNFWHMNIPGPCGPSSEIFIDRGSEFGEDGGPIGGGEDRFIEVWNLVFTDSIQDKPYEVVGELPSKNIDTGMGLERMAMVLQEKDNLFQTDLFAPIHEVLIKNIDDRNDKFEKIILDHMKSSTFMISDGVVPTNEGRGYILRRLIRRTIRAYHQLKNEINSLDYLLEEIINLYKSSYPELTDNKAKIVKLYKAEENLFQRTIEKGVVEINSIINKKNNIDSKDAFYLFETYGFPYELTNEIAIENNFIIDEKEFLEHFEAHKDKSSKSRQASSEVLFNVDKNLFTGYDSLESASEIYDIKDVDGKQILFFTETPFYYEAGGQVSDEGILISDEVKFNVTELVQTKSGATGLVTSNTNFQIGDKVTQVVDHKFRNAVSKSHTAAHMVHASLRNILGSHVAQAGSHVAPGRFRFDFSHTNKVAQDELDSIFKETNKQVFYDLEIETNIMNIEKAKEEGALAFFGDKYENDVRVVSIGNFSKELCGGTHVKNSNDVGLIVLTSESSIGSNLRRVEMLSGIDAYNFLSNAYQSYESVSQILKTNIEDVPIKLQSFLEDYEELSSKLSRFKQQELTNLSKQIVDSCENINNKKVYIGLVEVETTEDLKNLALNCISTDSVDIVVILSKIGDKTGLVGAVNKDTQIDISNIISEASQFYKGGASKDPKLSIGGGPGNFDDVKVLSHIENLLLKMI